MIAPGEFVAKHLSSYVKVNSTAVDVAPKKVFRLPDDAEIFFHGGKRGFLINGEFKPLIGVLEEVRPVDNFWILEPGRYYVVFPRIEIPENYTGFAFPRSSINRLGIIKSQTAVFDPGYRGEWNQTFWIPVKSHIHTSEAWVQVVFIRNESISGLYNGHWQDEEY